MEPDLEALAEEKLSLDGKIFPLEDQIYSFNCYSDGQGTARLAREQLDVMKKYSAVLSERIKLKE